jgi:hypothetical protein
MSDRPSDRAIAQAFMELVGYDFLPAIGARDAVIERAREIDAAAPEGAQAVACHRWRRNGEIVGVSNYGGWIDGPPSEREHGAAENLSGTCEWTVEYAYTAPPSQDAEDAARYRWLRDPRNILEGVTPTKGGSVLDVAIDAARAAEGDGHG